jgi:elongation factor 1 alpha-like protein
MDEGVEHIREILGPESQNIIPNSMIEDALWEYYFDIQKSLDYLLGTLIIPLRWHSRVAVVMTQSAVWS